MEQSGNSKGLGPLVDGGKVVIIGGGPGGVAAAIALRKRARELGRRITVHLVEGKQFAKEKQHNQCVGVLSPPIIEIMENELGLAFPEGLTRCLITGYLLHSNGQEIVLDGEAEPSISLRRIQFDDYMLNSAGERGVEVKPARATGLEFHDDGVVVFTENVPLKADCVIGAFGLDEGTGVLFKEAVHYLPPDALSAIVTKYHPGEKGIAEFGNRIHAFLPSSPWIEFGAVTPKGNHLTINIAGKSVNTRLMDDFLAMPEVRKVLPGIDRARLDNPLDLRYFKGRFPCSLAHKIIGDRYVIIGDAAGLVRAFKGKGVTSAIQTGIRAAEVILTKGISRQAFQFYMEANRDITEDLPVGQFMRYQTILAARLNLMGIVLRAAKDDPGLRRALFDSVSAHRSYREVVREGLTPLAARAIFQSLFTR